MGGEGRGSKLDNGTNLLRSSQGIFFLYKIAKGKDEVEVHKGKKQSIKEALRAMVPSEKKNE
jgi:hypothetical protein